MITNLLHNLVTPNPAFRAAPFWAWNSKLQPEELRRQIRIFKEMGLGGFFMHSRVGMNTPYLSEEWFQCINACIDEARKNGMDAWLYDEDRWPSGAAGGLVTSNPEFRQKHLAYARGAKAAELGTFPEENVLGRYVVEWAEAGVTLSSVQAVGELPSEAPAGSELLVIWWQNCATRSWFNNQTYLDTMNPEAVAMFIAVTHQKYLEQCGAEFGKTVPGIFTDEPCFRSELTPDLVAWTKALPEEFRSRFGYDILDHLPELFFNLKDIPFTRARRDFHETCTSLFVNSFSRQIGEWCEANGVQLTGHVFCEDRLGESRHVVGAPMRFYEYMQTPGIDLLTEHWDITVTAKQCSSAARQLGKQRRMCECYGCTGWDFPFAGHKALGDWLAVLGINFRVQHLAWYTMEAEAKRDYPASISFQSSWYKQYSLVEDYFARINAALWDSKEVRDILVIHPAESAWGLNPLLSNPERRDLDGKFNAVSNALLIEHLDFDYGDEELMSRYASVGTDDAGKPFIRVGEAVYSAVVIPEMITMRASTLALLKEFLALGGTVVRFGKLPTFVEGIESAEAAEALAGTPGTDAVEDLGAMLSAHRRLSVADSTFGNEEGMVYALLKNGGDCETLFLVNTSVHHSTEYGEITNPTNDPYLDTYNFQFLGTPASKRSEAAFTRITMRSAVAGADKVYELDLNSGSFSKVNAELRDGAFVFDVEFERLQSRLFIFTSREIEGAAAPEEPLDPDTPYSLIEAPREWDYKLNEPNVLVLDQAECRIDGKPLDDQVHFIVRLDDIIRSRFLGVGCRGEAMVQPWLNPPNPVPEKILDLELKFSFLCEALPEDPVALAIERPDLYEITLNNTVISNQDTGEWIDPAIRTVAVPNEAFIPGLNYLKLKCRYHQYLPGLEAIYLLGGFGVRNSRVLTTLPDVLAGGDWCSQGLPFYSGCVTYSTDFNVPEGTKSLELALAQWEGSLVGIRLNDGTEKLMGWPPYELSVAGEELKAGCNHLEITVYSSRRNTFGPFYDSVPSPEWVGSNQLKAFLVTDKQLVPCGLTGEVMIIALL